MSALPGNEPATVPTSVPTTMRAAVHHRYGPPEVLQVEDVPVPQPRAGEVLVQVHAVAASAADAALRAARPFAARLAAGLLRPRNGVLGSEVAGVVVALGPGVTGVAVGERVAAATGAPMGGYAEYARAAAAGLARVPDCVDLADAVGVTEGGLTALPFLRDQARVRPGQVVLVNGAAGSVGAAAVQLAVHLGAQVVAVCSAHHADLVRSLGAVRVVDRASEDFTAARDAYDVVFDTVARSSFRRCRRALRPGGVYLTTAPSPVAAVQSLATRSGPRRRVRLAFTGLRPQAAKAADMTWLLERLAAGDLQPVVGHRAGLDDVADVHRLVDSGHKTGSAVLLP